MNKKTLENYGYKGDLTINNDLVIGRVIEVQRDSYKIATDFGENYSKLKGSIFYNKGNNENYPVVGDLVLAWHNKDGEDIIHKVLERKSKFSRFDSFSNREEVIASNFDYVFIMTSLNYDFNLKRIERYLATAFESGATPVIVLTKSDLCDEYYDYISKIQDIALGVPIIPVSSLTGDGLKDLNEYISPGKTIVFLGSSGVGKSSLVNALSGDDIMKVSKIREDDSKGRHTTTHRQLLMLKNGAMIIDTPGMRSLALSDVTDSLDTTFHQIDQLSKCCKYNNCSHSNEPGCAVNQALKDGTLSTERWENYNKLKKEAECARKREESKKILAEKKSAGKKKYSKKDRRFAY